MKEQKNESKPLKLQNYLTENLLEHAVEKLNQYAEKSDVEACYYIGKRIPKELIGDFEQISNILSCLLENAIKHTKKGSITLGIQVIRGDRGSIRLKLSVADTGDGIEDDVLEKILSGKSKGKLDQCIKTLEQMEGNLSLFSEVNSGTIAYVVIPQKMGEETGVLGKVNGIRQAVEDGAGTTSEEQIDLEKQKLQESAMNIPQRTENLINENLGLSYCGGSQEMYQDIVESYYEEAKEGILELKEFYQKKDWKNYAIRVHALKSSSLTIGAKSFSEAAKLHEAAAKEGKIDFIDKDFEHLCEQSELVSKEIERLFKHVIQKKDENTQNEVASIVSKEEYLASYNKLCELVELYEMTDALEEITKLKKIKTDKSDEAELIKQLEGIERDIREFDYDEAEKKLETLKNCIL